jgi:hypothetical protein
VHYGGGISRTIVIDDNTNVTLSALLQPQAAVAQNAAPDGSPGTDFFLRRARLIVGGQLGKVVSFFVDTEQANLGKDGNWETSVFVQDAFLSLAPTDSLTIDAGMMLIPFTRHGLQSAASLNGIDYHSKLILFPAGGNRIWRDAGVQVRADIAAAWSGARRHLQRRRGRARDRDHAGRAQRGRPAAPVRGTPATTSWAAERLTARASTAPTRPCSRSAWASTGRRARS